MPDSREVQNSWDEFVKEYNFILKFGVQALQEKLNTLAASQGQTFRLNENHVKEIMPQIEQRLTNALDQYLPQLTKTLSQQHSPRADNVPELTNKNLLGIEEGLVARRVQQYEQAPWASKFDKASDTRVDDALNDIKDELDAQNQASPDKRNELTLSYKMKLKNDLVARAEKKLTMDYAPKMRPKRPGEM